MPTPVQDDATNQQLAEQLYDVLMAEIEPDLLLENIPTLDAKYAGETPEDKEARNKRYEVAYKKFDEECAKFMIEVDDEVKASKRTALKQKEESAKTQESAAITTLEQAFS
ncbi:MAG: hypothetical protein Q7R81_05435 [Candidatus Peregrinibacteria bacterium]|nr:hypothetical protein [Candidatus Peregrinibacteria bacterium]